MTPSGSVAGHLTDLVSGELGPGLCPARQSGKAGQQREVQLQTAAVTGPQQGPTGQARLQAEDSESASRVGDQN